MMEENHYERRISWRPGVRSKFSQILRGVQVQDIFQVYDVGLFIKNSFVSPFLLKEGTTILGHD